MQKRNFWLSKEFFWTLSLIALVAVPVAVFGGSKTVYVDKDNKGSEDGSANHPYRTISRALDRVKDGGEVHIAKGEYKENITIPSDVKLFGKKKDNGAVVIKADDDDEPAVTMKDDTELNHLTVKGGRHGIRVKEDSRAKIFDVKVKKSERDGIHIDRAPRDRKHRVLIDEVEVKDSAKAGIFSEKRDIVIINSSIENNRGDGIDLAAGTEAWIEHTRSNGNGGSGLKAIIDGSSVWSKNLSLRYNGREGAEINSYGVSGHVGFKKAAFVGNARYGIAKIARVNAAFSNFKTVEFGTGINENRFEGNRTGTISAVIRGF